ncbi:hypothetical protein BBK36DRAFT_1165553 [Trichoderma citrinoviride]|uniref:Uncharacterized protein n=1 Tax=Trichoderma citrinoviride TaxID=58853 RepID=A0A2T4BJ06_9HYPO|nr:hypothetical protein BBK36DRAFT_1165553 [Trichoderma citrinoviride]PTB69268.1 hypothetical protein BBK36DRAFT_1165553 [Trichoderma citrinoviride]
MVWPAAEPVRKPPPPVVESSSSPSPSSPSASSSESLPLHSHSFQPQQRYHRRQSANRPPHNHHIPPASPSPRNWHHHRQQQWLDRIPYDLPPQHPLLEEPSSQSTMSSSMPSTAPQPRGFINMPGSYYSRSNSPSSEEQAMFHHAHDDPSPPYQQPTNSSSSSNKNNRLLSPPPSSLSPSLQGTFPLIPSAQPRPSIPYTSSSSSFYEPSPPPFTNISDSTQAANYSESSSPMSPIPRPQVLSHFRCSHGHGRSDSGSERGSGNGNRRCPRTAEETEALALNAVVEGIGRMQVNMNLDQAGRWRIARRADAPW